MTLILVLADPLAALSLAILNLSPQAQQTLLPEISEHRALATVEFLTTDPLRDLFRQMETDLKQLAEITPFCLSDPERPEISPRIRCRNRLHPKRPIRRFTALKRWKPKARSRRRSRSRRKTHKARKRRRKRGKIA